MVRYDIVVYGASGFTGQYVVQFVHRAALEHGTLSSVAFLLYVQEVLTQFVYCLSKQP